MCERKKLSFVKAASMLWVQKQYSNGVGVTARKKNAHK